MTSHSSPPNKDTYHCTAASIFQPNQEDRQPFAKRDIKKPPTRLSKDALKDRRRNIFLKGVKDRADDKRFESRGVDMMRLDFLQRQRQWEAEQARSAPTITADDDDEAMEYGGVEEELPSLSQSKVSSQRRMGPEERAEEALRLENQELDALISLMPGQEEGQGQTQGDGNLWSDDDEYDGVFQELLESYGVGQASNAGTHHGGRQVQGDYEAMDMS